MERLAHRPGAGVNGVAIELSHPAPERLDAVFTLPARGLVGLVGSTGSGKGRLLRAIAGLEPASGSIVAGQHDYAGRGPTRSPFSLVFPEPRLFEKLTVGANLRLARPREERTTSPEVILGALEIDELYGLRPAQLNPLQRQLAALARAALAATRLLLVSEPLLDGGTRQTFREKVADLAARLPYPVLMAAEDPQEAARLTDRLVLMDAGTARTQGPVNELMLRLDLPLCHHPGAATRVRGVVASHDDANDRTHVDNRGGRFSVPRLPLAPGKQTDVLVPSAGISLLARPPGAATSAASGLPVVVRELAKWNEEWIVTLTAPETALLARVSSRAKSELKLEPGRQVYALLGRVLPAWG